MSFVVLFVLGRTSYNTGYTQTYTAKGITEFLIPHLYFPRSEDCRPLCCLLSTFTGALFLKPELRVSSTLSKHWETELQF